MGLHPSRLPIAYILQYSLLFGAKPVFLLLIGRPLTINWCLNGVELPLSLLKGLNWSLYHPL